MEPWSNDSLNWLIHLKFSLFLWEQNNLVLKQGILYKWARPRESGETLFQLELPATQKEVALKGCHDQIGHLGLECMLDLMHDQFFWPHMAAQAKEHIGKYCPYLAFKPKQPKAPLENIMATYPLELVHLDYLCLVPGKGLEENVLVVTDNFTRYAQHMLPGPKPPKLLPKPYRTSLLSTMGYPKRSCWIKAKILRVSWWLTSVSWWECKRYRPAHTIHRPMASVRGSTPLWLICWESYPQRRNQSRSTTMEHWSTLTIAPKTQPQGSVPTISCMEDNLAFQ